MRETPAAPACTPQTPDRLTGGDAFMLHLEGLVPMHTIKVLILDPARRGRPVSIDDVTAAAQRLVPYWPRLAQRLAYAPLHRGRPFLVDDPDFRVAEHVEERCLPCPGGRAELDALLMELANRRLDMRRPLWRATLISGLSGGRQAVAVSLHHALADGMAAITTLTTFTADRAGADPLAGLAPAGPCAGGLIARAGHAARDTGRLVAGALPLASTAWRTRRLAADFRRSHGMPRRALGAHRNCFSRTFGPGRTCATSSHPFADLQAISRATGATINGVLHAVVAEALRAELRERGEELDKPLLASFGIAGDPPGSRRLWGNNVSVTWINLHTDVADPLRRLELVAASARHGLELRRAIGLDLQPAAVSYATRLAARVVCHLGKVRDIAHIVTANVPGPREQRWIGDVAVADFYSLAVLVPPIGLNLTAYSYAGRLNIGLLSAPEVCADPRRLLARFDEALVLLCRRLGVAAAPRPEPAAP